MIGDLISGVLKGIGALIGELRKSRQAVAIMKLAASAIGTAVAVFLAAVGVGVDKSQAMQGAAIAAAVVLISSPLAVGLDIRLPLWLARAVRAFTEPEGWEISGPHVLLFEGGVLAHKGTILRTRPPVVPRSVSITALSSSPRDGKMHAAFELVDGRYAQWNIVVRKDLRTLTWNIERRFVGQPVRAFSISVVDGEVLIQSVEDSDRLIPPLRADERDIVRM